MEKTRQLQKILYHTAKKEKVRVFHALFDRMVQPAVLWRAWESVRKNKGAPGLDGETINDVIAYGPEKYLSELSDELKEGRYHAKTIRRVYIAKVDGSKRPLGIPTVRDRIVQQACRIVIEPIFEPNFLDCSHGYRPKRSAVAAVQKVRDHLIEGWHVLDADIKGFFDNMDHDLLIRILKKRIADGKVLKLIREWLEAPVSGNVEFISFNEKGTPQGGVISPLLSNIYLHVMDKYWELNCSHIGKMVRYADDFVIICRTDEDARKALGAIQHILRFLKLNLHPQKTKIVDMRKENFTFLGFEFRKWKSLKLGKLWPYRYPSKVKMKSIRTKLRALTCGKLGLLPLKAIVARVNDAIQGWWNYFRHGNSSKHFIRLDIYVFRRLRLHFYRRFTTRVKRRGEKFKLWWKNTPIRSFNQQWGLSYQRIAMLCGEAGRKAV